VKHPDRLKTIEERLQRFYVHSTRISLLLSLVAILVTLTALKTGLQSLAEFVQLVVVVGIFAVPLLRLAFEAWIFRDFQGPRRATIAIMTLAMIAMLLTYRFM
jgi:hypothetical protein